MLRYPPDVCLNWRFFKVTPCRPWHHYSLSWWSITSFAGPFKKVTAFFGARVEARNLPTPMTSPDSLDSSKRVQESVSVWMWPRRRCYTLASTRRARSSRSRNARTSSTSAVARYLLRPSSGTRGLKPGTRRIFWRNASIRRQGTTRRSDSACLQKYRQTCCIHRTILFIVLSTCLHLAEIIRK